MSVRLRYISPYGMAKICELDVANIPSKMTETLTGSVNGASVALLAGRRVGQLTLDIVIENTRVLKRNHEMVTGKVWVQMM